MIHATIRMTFPVQKANEAVKILGSVAERTRVQPGCISCRVYHDVRQQQVIMIEEVWKSQEDLDQHLRSAEYRDVLLVVEMAQEEPEIKFNAFSESSGIETIEKARSHGR